MDKDAMFGQFMADLDRMIESIDLSRMGRTERALFENVQMKLTYTLVEWRAIRDGIHTACSPQSDTADDDEEPAAPTRAEPTPGTPYRLVFVHRGGDRVIGEGMMDEQEAFEFLFRIRALNSRVRLPGSWRLQKFIYTREIGSRWVDQDR